MAARRPPARALPVASGPVASGRPIVRLPRAQRMHDIEAAARKVFALRGYAAASIAEIAAEAGVAEGTIYKFFATKRDLVLKVLESWYLAMLAAFETQLAGIHGARNKIRFIVWRHLRSLKDDPDLARLCWNEVRNSGDYYQTSIYRMNRQYTQVFVEACKDGVARGELRADLPIAMVRDLIFGGVDHHISRFLYDRGDFDVDRAADQICAIAFEGIAAPAASPAPALARLDRIADRFEQMMDGSAGRRAAARRRG